MSARSTAGFTIIETMLFLAVTGLLTIGVMATSAFGIHQQRYRDSVESLRGYIQEQYSLVANVENPLRSGAQQVGCPTDARVSDLGVAVTPRGRSDCVIVGRYLYTLDGMRFTASDVVAYRSPLTTVTTTNAIDELRSYVLRVNERSASEYEVNWGARITAAGSGNMDGRAWGMAIIRTPDSGSIKSFSTNDPTTVNGSDLATTIISDGASQTQQMLCVRPNAPTGVPDNAIKINAFASNQSAIEVMGEGEC